MIDRRDIIIAALIAVLVSLPAWADDHSRCEQATGWFEKGRCHTGLPTPWVHDIRHGPGHDDSTNPDRPERSTPQPQACE